MVELATSLLLEVVLPALATSALAAGGAAYCLGRKWGTAAAIGALAAGLAVGNWQRQLLPYWPEYLGWDCLLAAALACLVVGFAARFAPKLAALGAGLLCILLLASDQQTPLWWIGAVIVAAVNALTLIYQVRERPGPIVPASWAVVLFGSAAMVLLYCHNGRLADAAVLMASALVGIACASWLGRLESTALAPAVGTYLPGLMISAYHNNYSEVPPLSFALLAVAPWPLALVLWLQSRLKSTRWALPKPLAWQLAALALLPTVTLALAIYFENLTAE